MEKLPLVLDLTGTFVFALSGALAGVKRQLDLFGVLVLSFAAGNSGGITRDVLIGAIPPGAVNDWRYLGISLFAGVITFYFSRLIVRMSNLVLLFDAAGRRLWGFESTCVRTKPGHGDNARYGDRDWRRHDARLIAGRDSNRTARRTLRRRRTCCRRNFSPPPPLLPPQWW